MRFILSNSILVKRVEFQLRLDVSAVQEVVVRLGVPSAKLRGGTRAGEPPGGRAPSHAIADTT